MNLELKKQIAGALADYLKEHSLSGNEFAKKTTINVAYVSNNLTGNYTYDAGNNKKGEIDDKWFKRVAQFIGLELEKVYWNTVPTLQLMRIMATLEDAQSYGYTNVIIGETGCGKSYAARLFEQKNPKDFFLITVGQSDNLGDLLDKVIDKAKIKDVPRTKSKKLKCIADHMRRLKEDGNNPVIAFDEAEYMKQPALCAMKELYDNLNGFCAVQLIGTDQLLRKIEQLKKKNKDGIPQLYRRIKFGIRILPEIDRSFKQFLGEIDDKALKTFLQEKCDNYGELHDVLVPAMRESDRTGEPLTVDFIRKILNIR